MKKVYPIEENCINCHLCEVACIVAHSRHVDPIKTYRVEGALFNRELTATCIDYEEAKSFNLPAMLARDYVPIYDNISLSLQCRHCEEPECVEACKSGALFKNEQGYVLINDDICVGCWMCIMACSFGVITRNPYRNNLDSTDSKNSDCTDSRMESCPEEPDVRSVESGGAGRGIDLGYGGISHKCDLCLGRETPACVEFCPNLALVYEDRK